METLNLYQKLLLVQNELKAPKSQRDGFFKVASQVVKSSRSLDVISFAN
jgi:hypothetical protein